MQKLKCISAYVLGVLAWFTGIIIGIVWNMLYGAYQESNTIDITMLLAENITPALISVFFADYTFNKIFPDIKSKTINTIIFYIVLFLNYGIIICYTCIKHNYTNLIYVATGILSLIYLIYKLLNKQEKNKE